MKYKKYSYLLVFILMLVIGMNGVYAESSKKCYYVSEAGNFKASITHRWGYDKPRGHRYRQYALAHIDKRGATFDHDAEFVLNWIKGAGRSDNPRNSDVHFGYRYGQRPDANASEPTCARYLVFQECGTYKVWYTDSQTQAIQAAQDISTHKNCTGYYASNLKSDGTPYESEEYYSEFVQEGLVKLDEIGEPTCTEFNDMLGEKNDDGDTYDPDGDGEASVRYMLDVVLQYVRIIVPILIILLGTLDLAKAVIAGKEDAMKKARTDFVKRILIGVAVFFVPTLVDIVMGLAELIWQGEYLICDF